MSDTTTTATTATITADMVKASWSVAADGTAQVQAIRDTADRKAAGMIKHYHAGAYRTYKAIEDGVGLNALARHLKGIEVEGLSQGMLGYWQVTGSIVAKGELPASYIVAPLGAVDRSLNNTMSGKISAYDADGNPVMDSEGQQVKVNVTSLYSLVKKAIKDQNGVKKGSGKATVEAAIRNAADAKGAIEAVRALLVEESKADKTRAQFLAAVRGPLGKAAETSRDKGDEFDEMLAEVEALIAKVRANA